MLPLKLPPHKESYYYHWQFFHSNLEITRSFNEQNFQTGMHEQEFYEINIVLKGKGMHYIQDNRIPAKTGDVFIIPPHVPHGYYGGEGFDVYHVLLSDTFMNKYTADLQQLPSFFVLFSAEPLMRSLSDKPLHLSLNKSQFKKIKKLTDELSPLQSHTDSFEAVLRTGLTLELISHLCQSYHENSKKIDQNSRDDESFMRSISHIHECFNKKITISDLTQIAQMSRSSYISKFKRICKLPPQTYILKIRMESAKNMLEKTTLSVSEIAFRTGFYDTAHFSRLFEAENKVPPAQYRKNHQKNE